VLENPSAKAYKNQVITMGYRYPASCPTNALLVSTF
jgi:hypothetical protein